MAEQFKNRAERTKRHNIYWNTAACNAVAQRMTIDEQGTKILASISNMRRKDTTMLWRY